MAKELPEKIGKYEIIEEIAKGSMGVVYLAHDPFINRDVAVKLALSESLKDKETGAHFRQLFFNEAHTAGMLNHPNILDMYDAGMDGDECYLVMEYIEGGKTLKPYTRPESLLPVETVAEILYKCALALDYAHRQGVIHRDIKPSNILVKKDFDIKIADFSIAHVNCQDGTQTMPLGFVGSPRYMSPEQIQEDYITNQTDLFSLGVVMYELLTGQHPFGGESFSRLIHKVINEEPPPLRSYRKDLPAALEKIVRRALEKDTSKRYRMGLEIASDLSRAFSQLDYPEENLTDKERFNLVKRVSFFDGFPESELWEIIHASEWESTVRGQEIIIEGELDDCFYILVEGKVTVLKAGRKLGTLNEGDCFGEMGYISHARRTATIVARSNVTLMKANSALLEQVSRDCQLRFCKVFLKTLIRRLSLTTEQMVGKA